MLIKNGDSKENLMKKIIKFIIKSFAKNITLLNKIGIKIVVVHGGGPQIEKELRKRKIQDKEYQGLRITTKRILLIVKDILARKLNKMIISEINKFGGKVKSINGIKLLDDPNLKNNSCHLFVIKILKNFIMDRNLLFKYLLKNGIRTSVHYKPLNKFSFYKSKSKIYSSLEVSEQLYSKILSLPLFPQITKRELNLVINAIKDSK